MVQTVPSYIPCYPPIMYQLPSMYLVVFDETQCTVGSVGRSDNRETTSISSVLQLRPIFVSYGPFVDDRWSKVKFPQEQVFFLINFLNCIRMYIITKLFLLKWCHVNAMKWGVGPEWLFHESGKVGRSDATPINFFSSYGNISRKYW